MFAEVAEAGPHIACAAWKPITNVLVGHLHFFRSGLYQRSSVCMCADVYGSQECAAPE